MSEPEVRQQLVNMLTLRQAHMGLEDAVFEFSADQINIQIPKADYSFWHLIEHLRLAQLDILEYISAETYTWATFPDDYWPDKSVQADMDMWNKTLTQFYADRNQLAEIIQNPATDLYAKLPNSGEYNHNILREINIIASHNAYHIGEIGILRHTMGLWGPNHK